jgi:hypothetical protein
MTYHTGSAIYQHLHLNANKRTKTQMSEEELIKLSCDEALKIIDKDRRYWQF